MQNTNIIQGQFNATGSNVILSIPMGVNWMRVYNQTAAGGPNGTDGTSTTIRASDGVEYYWQLGMPVGTGFEYQTNAGGNATLLKYISSGGFTLTANPLVNSSDAILNPGATVVVNSGNLAITQASGSAAIATVTTDSIAGLVGFSVIRMNSLTTSKLFNGIDFQIDTVNTGAGTFNLTNTQAASYSTFTAAATAANFVPQYTSAYWYPPTRTILNIKSNGNGTSTVTTTVTAPYVTGQTVRFSIPKATTSVNWGLPGLNGVTANVIGVTAANTNGTPGTNSATFTIDIDVASGYGAAWNLPGSASVSLTAAGSQWAIVTPIGDVASQIIDTSGFNIPTNKFSQAEFNQGYIGMQLAGGSADQPGGRIVSSKADVVYWMAGVSFSNQVGLNVFPPMPPLGS